MNENEITFFGKVKSWTIFQTFSIGWGNTEDADALILGKKIKRKHKLNERKW